MTRLFFIAFLLIIMAGPSLAKDPIMTPPDEPMMGELDACIIENLYESEDADAGLPLLLADEGFQSLVEKHDFKLFGGPMVGCLTPNSAKIWVRTLGPAEVRILVGSDQEAPPVQRPTGSTSAEADFTTVIDIEGLQPDTLYYYNVAVNGEGVFMDELPSFRTSSAPGASYTFDVGFGGGARYNPPKERMWDTVNSFDPLAFLFLGDNIYIDEPLWRNKQRAMYYRRQMRSEHARFLSETAIYSIWDDHDFGVNDTSGGLDPFDPDWKVPAWRVFMENWNNPGYGGGESLPGCYYKFTLGDVEFFMTDGRYYRDFSEGAMLGPDQKAWLLESLSASTAKFKIIASGTLWTKHADKGGGDSWWGVPEEREEIFRLIDEEHIGGVALLSADRHRTDVYEIERNVGYTMYEFETSKMTNDHTHGTKPEAIFSYNEGNFFGMLTFDFTKEDPELVFRCITIDGETVYTKTLKLSELTPGGE